MPSPCHTASRWVLGSVIAAGLLAPSTAAAAALLKAPASSSSLQRTAAAIDDSIDVYRLALVELVPALRLLVQAAQKPRALPSMPVPALAHEVFDRLATSVQRRVSADALAALPRAYHNEIVEALEALAAAQCLEQVRLPARSLCTALMHQARLAADVVDIFSRERPISAEVLGPESALDSINDALGQLQLAEANISTIRRRQSTLGEQLQGFLRLEIALGRALDLIASAEQSGVHLGFEMPRATVGLFAHLEQMRRRLSALDAAVDIIEQPPAAVGGDLQAEVRNTLPPGPSGEMAFRWSPPPAGGHAPALLRLYTHSCAAAYPSEPAYVAAASDVAPPRQTDGQRLGAQTNAAAAGTQQCAASTSAPLEMAPGRSSAKLIWPPPASAGETTRYRLASVSAFGVEHLGPFRAPLSLPKTLAPPTSVTAALTNTRYDSSLFYYDAASVSVNWRLSPSDVADSTRAKAYAKANALPCVAHYGVYRLEGQKSALVGQIPAGVTQYTDRPPLAQLMGGIAYRVVALDAAGAAAAAFEGSDISTTLRADVQSQLALAAAGAAALGHPTDFERRHAQKLAAPRAMSAARAQFAALPEAQRLELWHRYWHKTPMGERVHWYETWVERLSPTQQTALWQQLPRPLAQRDRSMVQAGLWATQNPGYAGEASRYFALLTDQEQRQAIASWRQSMGPKLTRAFDSAMADQNDGLKQVWRLPPMQGVWFDSRDPDEQDRLVQSLQDLEAPERRALEQTYFASLPTALKQALCWPVWESLAPQERDTYLTVPPDILSSDRLAEGLWPDFLAWVAYEQLSVAAKVACIADEAGGFTHSVSRLRYWARPLDVVCNFKLWLYAGLITLGVINGVLLRLTHRPQSR